MSHTGGGGVGCNGTSAEDQGPILGEGSDFLLKKEPGGKSDETAF